MARFAVYDVFTSEKYKGNPLAVVFEGEGLDHAAMLSIAREFNFSETTFVLPPEDPAHTARVRIYTPTMELDFAGHPTVGTAIALAEAGLAGPDQILELNVGPIPVTIKDGRARFVTRVPLSVEDGILPAEAAACVGLEPDAIRLDHHAPVWAGLGTPFVLVELTGPDALAKASPNIDTFRQVAGPDADRLAIFYYLRDGQRIRARMFQPLGGILEDPATGSASAALAGFLGRLDQRSQRFEISQGVEMGRASRIDAEVVVENGEPTAVAIAGEAVKVMSGDVLT